MVRVVMIVQHDALLLSLALPVVAETFGEGIVIDFQLSDLDE